MWYLVLATMAAASLVQAAPAPAYPEVNTKYPYTGPAVPIMDPADQSLTGGNGFPRLWEGPAVMPTSGSKPTNNINVISLAYVPNGMRVHFQTAFGIGGAPMVKYSTNPLNLDQTAWGMSRTYDRTPPCSSLPVTQCSQHFHDVDIEGLQPATKYYYQIPGGNGTQASQLLEFTTGRVAGDKTPFTVAVINDMGYTNAVGTYSRLLEAVTGGAAFAWHGGDISYADDTYYAIGPCQPFNYSIPLNSTYQNVCYNGSMSTLPGGVDEPSYYDPLPEGEFPEQGGPLGGDMSTIYEVNWDLWQQWMNPITQSIPYMTMPGNHETSCSEGDATQWNETTAYMTDNLPPGSSAPVSNLSYWSCPPSQRNFTAYNNRFSMPSNYSGGRDSMWYAFTYGLARFISFSGETDYPNSPELPFVYDLTGNETTPTWSEARVSDAGPFGYINGNYTENESYEQWHWMQKELASIDRSVTPWVFVMSHRPMYSSAVSYYQPQMRAAWEDMFIKYGVDAYIAGHIHWAERMWPIAPTSIIDQGSVIDNHTYVTNPGKSLIHLTNGMAGNVESHSELDGSPILNITAFLDTVHYGYVKLDVYNESTASWKYILGGSGEVGDYLYIHKNVTK